MCINYLSRAFCFWFSIVVSLVKWWRQSYWHCIMNFISLFYASSIKFYRIINLLYQHHLIFTTNTKLFPLSSRWHCCQCYSLLVHVGSRHNYILSSSMLLLLFHLPNNFLSVRWTNHTLRQKLLCLNRKLKRHRRRCWGDVVFFEETLLLDTEARLAHTNSFLSGFCL